MLTKLGNAIEKKPWLIISIVVLITIGFSTVLPGLEFKTDFNDFLPDDELVLANSRVQDRFGIGQLPMFVLVEKQRAESAISPQEIREIYFIEK